MPPMRKKRKDAFRTKESIKADGRAGSGRRPSAQRNTLAPALPGALLNAFRKRAKVMALEPPPPPKLEGCRVSVCRKCSQPRMVPIKPAPSPAQIAAKLAKKMRVAEEARLRREEIVEDKTFMRRHIVGEKVASPPRPLPPASGGGLLVLPRRKELGGKVLPRGYTGW